MNWEFIGQRFFYLLLVGISASAAVYIEYRPVKVIALGFLAVMATSMAWCRADLQELSDNYRKDVGQL